MKINTVVFFLLGVVLFTSSFRLPPSKIRSCYLDFSGNDTWQLAATKRTTTGAFSWTEFYTNKGLTKIYLKDSYRLSYADSLGQPLADIELQLSDTKTFRSLWMEYCKRHAAHHSNDHGEPMVYKQLRYNGYDLFGSAADSIDRRPLLSIYYLFVNEKFLITFRMLNNDAAKRSFASVAAMENMRNSLIDGYTKHIANCEKK